MSHKYRPIRMGLSLTLRFHKIINDSEFRNRNREKQNYYYFSLENTQFEMKLNRNNLSGVQGRCEINLRLGIKPILGYAHRPSFMKSPGHTELPVNNLVSYFLSPWVNFAWRNILVYIQFCKNWAMGFQIIIFWNWRTKILQCRDPRTGDLLNFVDPGPVLGQNRTARS